MVSLRSRRLLWQVATLLLMLLAACGSDPGQDAPASDAPEATDDGSTEAASVEPSGPLTVYSGRSEELVGALLESFSEETGIEVQVRYGDTAELAATVLEEGDASPADVYFGQDAGALGALRGEGMLRPLPDGILDLVEPRFRAGDGTWVGVSGRSRVLVHNTDTLAAEDVPDSVLDLTDESWRGRVGWAPTNGSFQAFVTAMRVELGDDATSQWVEDMLANDVQVYDNNSAIVEAAARGEVDLGLVNHYYLYRFLAEDPAFAAGNAFFDGGDVGALVNVAGAGVLASSEQQAAAEEFVAYLLSEDAQRYFVTETFEYPLVRGIAADDRLPALESIETPDLDLSDLEDLQGTLELLRLAGALN
jgi:iron(III) transport system substrate-binding protein